MQTSNPYQPKPYVKVQPPDWVKNATIYEVNIRQFTPQGTFNAFSEHLPRLKQLGVDILWLMPIHPIGEMNRKGNIGSYYSVKDYKAVNPEFGTMEDFKALVDKAHNMGMYVILDWVANHSAWDNPLTLTNPEWYSKDHNGSFQPTPWWDWSDIIDFDYQHPGIREYMTGALKFWVEQADVDGYRADVAGFIPTDFWNHVRIELDQIKPVFMLAEWESRDLHEYAFDMSYSWKLHDVMEDVAHGKKDTSALYHYFAKELNSWPADAIKMNFVDNHDKNSWEDTVFVRFQNALKPAIVLTATAEGMPLIYSGQEAGLDKALAFFEKDEITWQEHEIGTLYKTLFGLKHDNRALFNGNWGGHMMPVPNNQSESVLSFVRETHNDKVFVVLNFSDAALTVEFDETIQLGEYTELFSNEKIAIRLTSQLSIDSWGYKVLVK
ncbi:alpha-amylase family glycosyl hydrolase [Thalassotalea ponticola]|uniref:alpha-amylase family glycosyl hydrolase n=1 Tax=Thalassotalea ponticola TaxID=1523392 RepID=UPI0025B496E2|nr:alpha-amylase family glycosyl hydrolase [Thalassotalea ponticola]MDN3652836.1 alpha-amylase family glycosyl hydrolase [Thalassotalea ponticola]